MLRLKIYPVGVYTIQMQMYSSAEDVSFSLSVSTLNYFKGSTVDNIIQVGSNGLVVWFGNNRYLHISDTEGFHSSEDDERNRQGMVCRATISSSGGVVNQRGAVSITASKDSMGKYKITHGLNTKLYSIHLSANTKGAIASYTNRQTLF